MAFRERNLARPIGRHSPNAAVFDVKPAGPAAEPCEEIRLGSRHPDLTSPFSEPDEECLAPDGVEMRCHFVQQQDRSPPHPFGDEIGMGKDDAEQQGLLLTR